MRAHPLIAGATVAAVLFTLPAFAADSRLLNLVMPNATSLAGANVTNAEITPFGQYVLTQLTSAADQQMQAFINATGFDPRHDVTEILAASAGTVTTPSGLVLALGNFPVSQLTAAVTGKTSTVTLQTYGGATLITNNSTKATQSVAFLGSNIAIMGDTASVKAAIDRSSGVNSLPPALAVQVQNLSTTEDAWAITTNSVATLIPGMFGPAAPGAAASPFSQFAQMFSAIQATNGGIKFGSTVQINGQAITTDAATAKSLADVFQALISIASMAGGQDPQIASMAKLIQGLTVSADGPAINVALSIPETQLEGIINSMKNQAQPMLRKQVRPATAPKAISPAPAVERAAIN